MRAFVNKLQRSRPIRRGDSVDRLGPFVHQIVHQRSRASLYAVSSKIDFIAKRLKQTLQRSRA